MKNILLLILTLLIVGCGYKPSTRYTNNIIGDKVYTEVKIKLQDPENSVIIKDNIKDLVVKKLNSSLASEKDSDTKLYITISRVDFDNLQYDENGYVVMKRARLTLSTKYVTKDNKVGVIETNGAYDFSTSTDALTDQERFNAINATAVKALDSLISKLTIVGIKAGE